MDLKQQMQQSMIGMSKQHKKSDGNLKSSLYQQ